MTIEYQKVWSTMNDLEMVTSKICSAREIIDNAVDKIQGHEYDKAELLMNAAYEFLEYYLQEFDDKFKLAWQATVGDLRDGDREAYNAAMRERDYYENVMPSATQKDIENFEKLQNTILWPPETKKSDKPNLTCDKDDSSPECKGAWDSFWEDNQQYTEEELNAMCDKAELDAQVEKIRKDGGYEWTPAVENPFTTDTGTVIQNGVTYTEYVKAQIEASSAWNDGWTKEHYQKIVDKYEGKQKEVKKWVLPVEEAKDMDTDETEYFVSFPQDLLETANLKEGDTIEWVDNKDGSYTIRKV